MAKREHSESFEFFYQKLLLAEGKKALGIDFVTFSCAACDPNVTKIGRILKLSKKTPEFKSLSRL